MTTDNIKVSVETSREGRPVRTYVHDGRTYIESHEDLVYRVRVKNLTSKRIMAVISVDGRSIVTGKPVSTDSTETGYILGPYAEELFRGFRVDENQIAEFTFGKRETSYATEKGDGQGNGVIAVRAFAEKEKAEDKIDKLQKLFEEFKDRPREKEYIPYPVRPWYWEDHWYPRPRPQPIWYWDGGYTTCGTPMAMGASKSCDNSLRATSFNMCATTSDAAMGSQNAMPMAAVAQSAVEEPSPFGHGTHWGQAVADKVTEVAFEVGNLLAEVAIYYAPVAGLIALGVNMTRDKQVAFPEAFRKTWAEPPKGWTSGVK